VALEIVFWAAVGLIVYAHLGYPLLLGAGEAVRRGRVGVRVAGGLRG
jgi:hypothetical protein